MAIGRPISLTPNIATKNISVAATEGQSNFTISGGYRINEIGVFRNGVRLADGRDFAATDGSVVRLVDSAVADESFKYLIHLMFQMLLFLQHLLKFLVVIYMLMRHYLHLHLVGML